MGGSFGGRSEQDDEGCSGELGSTSSRSNLQQSTWTRSIVRTRWAGPSSTFRDDMSFESAVECRTKGKLSCSGGSLTLSFCSLPPRAPGLLESHNARLFLQVLDASGRKLRMRWRAASLWHEDKCQRATQHHQHTAPPNPKTTLHLPTSSFFPLAAIEDGRKRWLWLAHLVSSQSQTQIQSG